jgi:competence protein ComGC
MRLTPLRKSEAFTSMELIVVMVVGCLVIGLLLPMFSRAKARSPRLACVNNLKQIGTAYRLFPNDQASLCPAQTTIAFGGWKEILTNADQGFLTWTNYATIANHVEFDPKLIVCPSDERKPVDTFTNLHSNLNVSYFVGVSANDEDPNSLLGGDRNLAPGTTSKNDYGFSPDNGKGNDVAIQTNTQVSPVCWSLKMHSNGNTEGTGNILLGDGSVQQATSGSFRSIYLPQAGQTNNWRPELGENGNWPLGHAPISPSIRVLFP